MNIEGNLTIVGDTLLISEIIILPTSRYYSIPSTAFEPIIGGATCHGHKEFYLEFAHEPGNNHSFAQAPIHLPHDCEITKVVDYVSWSGNIGGFSVGVIAVPFFGALGEINIDTIGFIYTPGPPWPGAYDSLVISHFSNHKIDNARYRYLIQVKGWSDVGNFLVYGARIEYIINKPLP